METEILKTELDFYFAYSSYIKIMHPELHNKATEWAEKVSAETAKMDSITKYEMNKDEY